MDYKKLTTGLPLVILLCFFPKQLAAQELLFEKIPEIQSPLATFGPNQKNFCHSFVSLSLFLPNTQYNNIKINWLTSGSISFGARYKRKCSKSFSWIIECGFSRNYFNICQFEGKNYPDPEIHHAQFVRSDQLFGGTLIRIRLGQKGDYLGNFIDTGIVMEAPFNTQKINKEWVYSDNTMAHHIVRTTISGINDFKSFTYNAIMRIGLDRCSLVLSYRLSHLLVPTYHADLPQLKLGIEFSPVMY